MPRALLHDLAAWSGYPETWAIICLHGVRDTDKSVLAAQLLGLRLPHVRSDVLHRAALTTALLGAPEP